MGKLRNLLDDWVDLLVFRVSHGDMYFVRSFMRKS